ncbi:nucleotide sugar dehydrogenase [Paracoccaceae bacterium]|nr:nucleotide sugar dehydrogenase [Paracoccaceae bacterium]
MGDLDSLKPAVIGLGYVGLPLAVEMAKKFDVIGFDINHKRVHELRNCIDVTKEVSSKELSMCASLRFSNNGKDLANCNIYVVTVPTPIDKAKRPDLLPLVSASKTVGTYLKKGDIVVYESTVYPGATEEVCIPVLESESDLKFNEDFFVGYSPERINPGDKDRRVGDILKVTSGSNESASSTIDNFYSSFIAAGTYKANSIKVAEAAKVIENTQRDVNIALINELATLFDKLDIDTHAVLEAAATKWNFLHFVPGLVGGHCIGVDPYYLTHKAQEVGFHPEIISAGRRVNDAMPKFVADKLLLSLIKSKVQLQSARILILGATFKENCPDLRNSKVIELISILQEYGLEIDIFDPHICSKELHEEYNLSLQDEIQSSYHAIILAVKHSEFLNYSANYLRSKLVNKGVIFDLKNIMPPNEVDLRL